MKLSSKIGMLFEDANKDKVVAPGESKAGGDATACDEEEELDEASDAKLEKLVTAMLYSPRVESILGQMGIDEDGMEDLKGSFMPAVKLALSKAGVSISGGSAAKMAVRTMSK